MELHRHNSDNHIRHFQPENKDYFLKGVNNSDISLGLKMGDSTFHSGKNTHQLPCEILPGTGRKVRNQSHVTLLYLAAEFMYS